MSAPNLVKPTRLVVSGGLTPDGQIIYDVNGSFGLAEQILVAVGDGTVMWQASVPTEVTSVNGRSGAVVLVSADIPNNTANTTGNAATATLAATATHVAYSGLTGTIPTWNQNTTGYAADLAGGVAGSVLYQTAANVTTELPIGTTGEVLTVVGGVPAWAPGSGYTTDFQLSTITTYTITPSNASLIFVAFNTAGICTVTFPTPDHIGQVVGLKYNVIMTTIVLTGGTFANASPSPPSTTASQYVEYMWDGTTWQ